MALDEAARKRLRPVYKTLIAFVVLMLGMFAMDQYKAYPVNSFCAGVEATATVSDVVESARSKGFVVLSGQRSDGSENVTALNHMSFIFRHACIVSFQNGRLLDKKTMTAD